jgi:hypothetical protein
MDERMTKPAQPNAGEEDEGELAEPDEASPVQKSPLRLQVRSEDGTPIEITLLPGDENA